MGLPDRRVWEGDDHPNTLGSASNLAANLRALGEVERALELDEDTVARCRRALGEDHPHTWRAIISLADSLRMAGDYERATQLNEEILAYQRRVLGETHPDTVKAAHNLAADWDVLGRKPAT
jgi:hypothetical protein